MPDELSDYEKVLEKCKTVNGNRAYHGLYLKAVNHPLRRKILTIINEANKISRERLFKILSENKILSELSVLDYNIDFLIKALCIEKVENKEEIYYCITQSGKVIEYLK